MTCRLAVRTGGSSMWTSLLRTQSPPATLLVRIAVGSIFLSEGLQKFIYPEALGTGRFAKIGIPFPFLTGPFVGTVELVGGALVLLGLLTRAAAVPLLVDMCVALLSTKLPILLGHGFWGFAAPSAAPGFWGMTHEARTDFSMLLGSLFLLIEGAGPWSLDAWLAEPRRE